MKRLFFFAFAALLFSLDSSVAQTTNTPSSLSSTTQPRKKIIAGVFLCEPFSNKENQEYQGYCVDLWKAVAAEMNQPFEFLPFTNLSVLLEATAENKVDVAIGNISITSERLKLVDFTQPYLQGGMQIMVDEKRGDSLGKLWNGLQESGHLKIFGIGIGIIILGTIILTFCERQWNQEFHPDWHNGLAESFYHVMSIAMTGKSTHRGLPGPFGKILSAFWLAFGVGVVAYITSSVTSVMTVNHLKGIIDGPQDLPGHHVGTIGGTLAQKYCQDQGLYTTLYSNLPDAVKELLRHRIDAIVFDAMSLQWYDNAHPELPITEVGPIFMKKGYGFALPLKSPLRHEVNQALIQEQESGFAETLRKQYFGDIP